MPTTDFDEIYVCAGICRMDPETSTCIGCGRPVGDLKVQANVASVPLPPADTNADDKLSTNAALSEGK